MSSRKRWIRAAAVGAASALLLAACGGDDGDGGSSTPTATNTGPVTLKINYWGEFGFKELKAKWEADHPNIKLSLNPGDYAKTQDSLAQYLVAGSGAPDVTAIDEGYIVKFRNMSDYFVNVLDMPGGKDREKDYLPWKWKQSMSADGKVNIGLGTDIGGQAMCYRRDLFKKAGLPTERDEVGALWPTWDAFIEEGKKYVKATGGKKKFIDDMVNVFNPVLSQQPVGYFDTSENLQLDGGPKVAWDTATKTYSEGISANLTAWSAEWTAGFANGDFAVLACPAWMLGHIQTSAPKTTGKWDIATIPGGGGNWGGSFLSIPKQGKNIQQAWEFVNWVTQPPQQLEIFKTVGNLPSQPAIWTDQSFQDYKKEFFNNAPTGVIFAKTAEGLQPQYLGKKNNEVRDAIQKVLTKVQQGKTDPVKGWEEAKKEAEAAAQK